MTAAATDADLIAAHARGDPNAFSEIVLRHRDRMWAVALRTMRNHEDAADALQEAFVSAYRAAANFRAESQVSTWLHRIVVNACLDRIRKQQARPTVPLPETDEYREPAAPGDSMAQRETNLIIADALRELPEDQRVPIVLVDVEGYSVAETAEMLGIAGGTVKSRCARGRAKLAQLLGHLRNPDANANVPASGGTADAARPSHPSEQVHPTPPRRTEGR
ncbi:RNA polymerase, sigma subunit, ECF family [Haloechinothrix alba]|uniref:RNA polymerase, sigma subunit, ECF family n=1 Tax=Haloechinothrix alba TaxID=664784 RepID=A0A238V297_9PSEU|nr:RNA polymerase sigma factor SigM [Haloechinothrix alba]SNR27703.1 RNA polymerase, sigma subunit, ECF family [Haloechinothrix alba]